MVYDLTVEDPKVLASKSAMVSFMLECIQAADMQILAGPYVLDTGAYDPNPGLTGWTVLTTSHISVHTFLKQQAAFIDLFSCKEFDPDLVEFVVRKWFSPESLGVVEVARAEMTMFHEESNVVPLRG
jgi:S-adenosylmethionine decarboxylase